MKSYEHLPVEAKAYIAEMLASIIDVAYPDGWMDQKLPEIRFIGIGPDPGEIISDLPSAKELLQSSTVELSVAS